MVSRVLEKGLGRAPSRCSRPAEPLRRVCDEAGLAHLAIAHHVEARGCLLPYAICNGLSYARRVGPFIDGLSVHLGEHHFEQVVGTRQAADMRRQDTISTELHHSFQWCPNKSCNPA